MKLSFCGTALSFRGRAGGAYSVDDRHRSADGETVMLLEMLLHPADKSAIRAHCSAAIRTLEMEMVAVTTAVSVNGTLARRVYKLRSLPLGGEKLKTAVDGGLGDRMPRLTETADYLLCCKTSVVVLEVAENKLSLLGFVSVIHFVCLSFLSENETEFQIRVLL